jgi:ketosteroid isomerase-like protein
MNEEGTIRELTEIEQRLAKAWVQNDRDTIDSILASHWSVIEITGRVLTKSQLMEEAFGSQERRVEAMTIDDMQVRVLGSFAVVSGHTVAEGRHRGQSVRVELRFTDVFTKRSGRWQAVCSQATPVCR